MATEFTPGGPVRRDRPKHSLGTHWSTYVILALLAVVIVSGLVLTLRDERVAQNDSATVGSTAPVAPAAPVTRP
jgi:hypothetical protein